MVVVAEFEAASIRVTVSSASFATQRVSEPAATELGRRPTVIVLTTPVVLGLTRDRVLSPAFATQTDSAPTATAEGDDPATPVAATLFVAGLILATSPPPKAAQTAPPPKTALPAMERNVT
jgi:hypothetical protein